MIVSHKYKLIFLHYPKNAVTNITSLLTKLDPNIVRFFIADIHHPSHGHIDATTGKNLVSPEVWNEYTKFGVIRNSFDWHVSLYNYMNNHPHFSNLEPIKDKCTFKQYLNWSKENMLGSKKFYMQPGSQKSFFTVDNKIIENLLDFNNLENELYAFLNKYSIPKKDLAPANINKSVRDRDYKNYYNEELINTVKSINKEDIDYFKLIWLNI